ncbi:M66 family metalloprotease, partial [Acinetobacter bereziniae]|uniref:M66 family metalloprotease n=3 Tax=Moraxellaceae TaxID=468 RepID=UPI0021D15ED8
EIDKINNKNEFFYENTKIVNIKCEGGALNQHEEINVFAVKNGVREKVGKLMLYKNNDILKLELNFIDVISDNYSIDKPNDYEYYLKFKSYNQALIRAEKRLETKFNLLELAKNNEDVAGFLAEVNSSKQLDIDYLANRFVDLFDKYGGKYRPIDDQKYLNINDDGHTRTYIFYTNISAGNVNGYAPSRMEGRQMKWGNAIVVFKQAHTRMDVLVHEIGHSLGLPHVFEKNNNKFEFYQGQSGNLMDYTWFYKESKQIVSKITRKYFSKFQWDILRSDRSLK